MIFVYGTVTQQITANARAELRIGYHIITCHLELNISQQFGMHKKGFYDSCHKNLMSTVFEIPL
jgi:hypothetical protein